MLGRHVELVVTCNLTEANGARAQLADALVGLRVVGSGAGAPALALCRTDLHVTSVEPLQKRVAFLGAVIATLSVVSRVSGRGSRAGRAVRSGAGARDLRAGGVGATALALPVPEALAGAQLTAT